MARIVSAPRSDMTDKIDFVIPWVDGSDPEWLKEKDSYSPNPSSDDRDIRFRDWGLLRYWFRAIEENAPWVNRVFFVTWGHLPSWLNTKHEKLRIIKHNEYIPEEYLPTFSSHVIELNLHRIQDLSEHFVYFNDDVYLLDKVTPKDFFINGLPCDCLVENPITPLFGGFTPILIEMGCIINEHFKKSDLKRLGWKKYMSPVYKELLLRNISMSQFTNIMGFYNPHISQPHLKSTFEEVWQAEYDKLNKTCQNRFRGLNEVNQYIFRYWNLCKGRFEPKYPMGKNVRVSNESKKIAEIIKSRKFKVITINDAVGINDYNEQQQIIASAFQQRYPNASSFEV